MIKIKTVHFVTKLFFLIFFLHLTHPTFAVNATTDIAVSVKPSSIPTIAIAVVNVRHLLQHAPQSEKARKKLKQRFLKKEQELDIEAEAIRKFEDSIKQIEEQLSRHDKIEKERELRSRKRAQTRDLEDYREDLRLAKNMALDGVQKVVYDAIDQVRRSKNIDIVIQDFVSASERVDITSTVLSYLADKLKENKKKSKK